MQRAGVYPAHAARAPRSAVYVGKLLFFRALFFFYTVYIFFMQGRMSVRFSLTVVIGDR